jgi:tRNA A37 threonylcarbamoyladenosine modification protein TsaB
MAHPKPVVQINSLAAAAASLGLRKGVVGVVLNARKCMYFYQKFKLANGVPAPQEEAMVGTLAEIPALKSDGVRWISPELDGMERIYPAAAQVARLAEPMIGCAAGRLGEPRYLRPPV